MSETASRGARPRVLAIGYSVAGTGLSRVMEAILNGLPEHYDVQLVGLGYQGEPVQGKYRLLPSNLAGGDIFGVFQGLELIETWQPEIVFILHDLWQMQNYIDRYRAFRDRTKLVTYIPLDGNVSDPEVCLPLADVDAVVVYTDWAKGEVKRAFEQLRASGKIRSAPPVEVIGHGVDTSVFSPLPELFEAGFDPRARGDLKRQLFPALPAPDDSFIVLNASRPGNRKRIDLTIEGFAGFAAGKPDNVCLCLHQAMGNEQSHQEYMNIADELGVRERIECVALEQKGPLTESDLNLLYNACDVGLNSSMGEGWGLVSFEHAAAGAAQIVPRHSACAGLWDGVAEFLEPVERGVPRFSTLELQTVSAVGVEKALQRLYHDRSSLKARSQAAFEHATQSKWSWPVIVAQWDELFQKLADHGD